MTHETDEYDRPEYAPIKRSRRRSSGGAKVPLAIRAMAGEIAWLEGYPVWHGDRVAWQQGHDVTVPTGPRLALAQRRLNQIARHPTASTHVFGDAAGWIALHTNRLHLAKQLSVLHAPELPDLAARARTHDRAAIRTLSSLLVAEAFCVRGLPVLPSSALAACGEQAEEAVRQVMHDQAWPHESRALAALVLGAIHAKAGVRADASVPDISQARGLQRACRWGAEHGLPHHPPIMATLLLDERGVALAPTASVGFSTTCRAPRTLARRSIR